MLVQAFTEVKIMHMISTDPVFTILDIHYFDPYQI